MELRLVNAHNSECTPIGNTALDTQVRKNLNISRKAKIVFVAIEVAALIAVLGILLFCKAPGKIENLTTKSIAYDSICLEWNAADNADGYRIYRVDQDGKLDLLEKTSETSYTDAELRTGKQYKYVVSPYNGLRRGSKKAEISATPMLDTPNLKVTTKNGDVRLSYSKVDGAYGYEIRRDGKVIQRTEATEFTDENAKADREYTYSVLAYRYKKAPVYSEESKLAKAELISAGKIEPEILGSDLVFRWDKSDFYNSYRLICNGETISIENGNCEYTIKDVDAEKRYNISLTGIADDKTVSPTITKTFAIEKEPMTNEEARLAACDWAVEIANDNSFSYGTGERAHRCGCYFCGTNTGPRMNKKGKSLVKGHSYEKTYCCVTFVTACYAHGAGDPKMLELCQGGGTIQETAKSFKGHGAWKNIGKPKAGNLQPGDVICRPDHVMLYIGNGQVAHAIGSGGWSDRGILVSNLGKKYNKATHVMRYNGNGRGEKLAVKEVAASSEAPLRMSASRT